MADIAKLRAELTADPLGRGYAGMTDVAVAADLNTVYCERNKSLLTATEVLNAIVLAEFNALTDAVQRRIWDVIHIGEINPFGVEEKLFIAAFGAGSVTIANLAEIRKEAVSRAVELGIGFVYPGHVQNARM